MSPAGCHGRVSRFYPKCDGQSLEGRNRWSDLVGVTYLIPLAATWKKCVEDKGEAGWKHCGCPGKQ